MPPLDMRNNGVVPFSQRIKDRHRRWWQEGAQVNHKHVGGKLAGRQFAESLGCKVPHLYGLVDIDEIPEFSDLPSRFVIKPSVGWSAKNVFAIEDGINLLQDAPCTRKDVVSLLHSDPKISGGANVKILIEEFLQNWDGKRGIPYDYKFYTFADDIAFIHVIERNSNSRLAANRHWYLTEKWDPLSRQVVTTQIPEHGRLPKPDCFDELVDRVKTMGRELGMFMRIDMYATDRGAVFGEFTPQPHGGNGFTAWADQWLGSLWRGVEGCG